MVEAIEKHDKVIVKKAKAESISEFESVLGKREQPIEEDLLRKRAKVDVLARLPSANLYEKSFMHKETVSHVLVSHVNEFIFTASTDGYVKFWKKASEGIEFVKTYRAHLSKITGFALS